MKNQNYDVLGFGCCTVDDSLYVEAFPQPDTKHRVLERARDCGGLTVSALVAASRLGARCAYAGALGRDELSQFVAHRLRAENVDLSHIAWRDEAQPIHSTILVDSTNHTRTILWSKNGEVGAPANWPQEKVIRNCRVLFLDHYATEAGIRAAKIARENCIPVVADLERDNVSHFSELLGLVDHLIISQPFALHLSNADNVQDAVRVLVRNHDVVVVTCGADGVCFAARANPTPRRSTAFQVEVVDTTGCGDIFHGAYACELSRDADLETRVRFASAAAAMAATRRGVCSAAPTRTEVQAMLKKAECA